MKVATRYEVGDRVLVNASILVNTSIMGISFDKEMMALKGQVLTVDQVSVGAYNQSGLLSDIEEKVPYAYYGIRELPYFLWVEKYLMPADSLALDRNQLLSLLDNTALGAY